MVTMAATTGAGGALAASGLSAEAASSEAQAAAAQIATPNVLMIVNDEERHWNMIEKLVGSDLLGSNTDPAEGTFRSLIPARMRLRNSGVRFSNYYTATAPCSPARCVMYTGHHGPDNQVVDNMDYEAQGSLNPEIPTMADVLAQAGYYCAYKGKAHLAHDTDLVTAQDMYDLYGFQDWQGPYRVSDSEGPQSGFTRDDDIADYAATWLSKRGKLKNAAGQPWLLAVNFINPHDIMLIDVDGDGTVQMKQGDSSGFPLSEVPSQHPYYYWWNPKKPANFYKQNGYTMESCGPRPEILDEFASLLSAGFGNIPYNNDPKTSVTVYQDNAQPDLGTQVIEVPMWKAYLNYYLNCIIDNDQAMSKVLDSVVSQGLQDNTIIIYTADHGELGLSHMGNSRYFDEASTPGYETPDLETKTVMPLRQKGPFVYEENNNVPFVVSTLSTNPDSLASSHVPITNKNVPALASSLDILPTMLGWAGKDGSWYEDLFGATLGGLKMRSALPGVPLHNVITNPDAYTEAQWNDGTNGRKWVLFTADSVSSLDADYTYLVLWGQCEGASINTAKKGVLRGCFNGKYKYARYFSPEEYYLNKSAYADLDYETLISSGAHGQDIQLFDLSATPNETFNTAEDLPGKVTSMNNVLYKAMSKELYSVARTPQTMKNILDGTVNACD
jgi:arylsulfatase